VVPVQIRLTKRALANASDARVPAANAKGARVDRTGAGHGVRISRRIEKIADWQLPIADLKSVRFLQLAIGNRKSQMG
jgi:hypothetical protein